MRRLLLLAGSLLASLGPFAACTAEPTSAAVTGEPLALRLIDDHAVTPPGARYAAAAFSPDGQLLAVAPAGLAAIDVVAADGDGRDLRRLAEGDRAGSRFAWAPDGRSIVHRDGADALVRTDLAGARTSLVERGGGTVGFPAFGPRAEVLFSRGGEVLAAAPSGAIGRPAGRADAVAQPGLVVVTAARAPRLAGWDGARIFTVDLATGERRELLEGPGFFDVELSADGRVALVRESRGTEGHLWVVDATGADGGWRRDLGVGWGGRLTADGRAVVYVLQTNDGAEFLTADLWIASLDGARRARVTDTPDRLEIEPVLSADGSRLAYLDAATGRVHVARLAAAEVTP